MGEGGGGAGKGPFGGGARVVALSHLPCKQDEKEEEEEGEEEEEEEDDGVLMIGHVDRVY